MPIDLIYHTYINEQGKPQVDPGPVLRHGAELSVFFFNEVNRARPQVHSLLLRIMAERSVSAFAREHAFPYLQVFADRNRVEKEETFEMPSAARDRFMMELHVQAPSSPDLRRALMFEPRFHDVDRLVGTVRAGVLPYRDIPDIARAIQGEVQASDALQSYALDLWAATWQPERFGVTMDGVDIGQLVLAGASPRGMSMMMRAARVLAWLDHRSHLIPEDLRKVFVQTTAHRVFFTPVYELRRNLLIGELMNGILRHVAAP
jgi:MoxR-like ATPase